MALGTTEVDATPADPITPAPRPDAFEVHLEVFSGPFDLLLGLIAKHQLDITDVALSQVTDEFIAYLRSAAAFDLGQATEFLVVAATLLDLKAARLLPSGAVEDEDDLALLEARDLLFARLLQYRAYKQVANWLRERWEAERCWVPREVALPPELAAVLPEVVVGIGPQRLAELAARAMTPRPVPLVALDHVHVPRVSVREHMLVLTERLHAVGTATFRSLCADCEEPIEVIARFLAVLELYREGSVSFTQLAPLGELQVRWVATPQNQHREAYDEREKGGT